MQFLGSKALFRLALDHTISTGDFSVFSANVLKRKIFNVKKFYRI